MRLDHLTPGDRTELRRFAAFLQALNDAGIHHFGEPTTPEQEATKTRIYLAHYPVTNDEETTTP